MVSSFGGRFGKDSYLPAYEEAAAQTSKKALPKSIHPSSGASASASASMSSHTVTHIPAHLARGVAKSVDEFVTHLRSADGRKALLAHLRSHGFASTLRLLDSMSDTARERGARYTGINPWPSSLDGDFLHIHRVVGKESKGMPIKGTLKTFLEPPLEAVFEKEGTVVSALELLLMEPDEVPEAFLEEKEDLDAFYKGKMYFPVTLDTGESMHVTIPTKRYTDNQFIVIADPRQKDVVAAEHAQVEKRMKRGVEVTERGSSMVHTAADTRLSQKERDRIVQDVGASTKMTATVTPNDPDIAGMASVASELPPGSMIGQNSPDTSSDKSTKHFQVFTDIPDGIVPLFSAKGMEVTRNANMVAEKLDDAAFPGPVYRLVSSKNNAHVRSQLEAIQKTLEKKEHDDVSVNLVVHKRPDGMYEYYFVLRKNMDHHPELKENPERLRTNCPGWLEMCGVRLSGDPEVFSRVPDSTWREEILAPFTVSGDKQKAFETALEEVLSS